VTSRRAWARRLWEEQPGLHRGYRVDVLTAIAMAAALILGGRQRTVAVAWGTLNANGGPVLWGSVFAACAVVLVLATFVSGRAMMLALWVAAVPYALLGWWFADSVLSEPSASFVSVIFCVRTTFMHLSRGEAYRVGTAGPGS
jgi:hypothetical protein